MKRKKYVIASLLILIIALCCPHIISYAKSGINYTSKSIVVGKSTQLKVKGEKVKKWSSSNKKVATVSNKGLVTGKKAGKATISAKTSKRTYRCKIIVKSKPVAKPTVSPTGEPATEPTMQPTATPSDDEDEPHGELKAVYIDVGQGNAELIQTPEGKNILIDTGKKSAYNNLKKILKENNAEVIDYLIISHPDQDHMDSAEYVIKDYGVKKCYMSEFKKDTYCYKYMMKALEENNVNVVYPDTGDKISFTDTCVGTVLSVNGGDGTDANAASLVLRVTFGDRSFIYMGDAPAAIENEIMTRSDVASDVYLISHHGSASATGILFAKSVLSAKYKYAVISVGKDNDYGHPVANVIRRLETFSDKILRTDEAGTITFVTDGNEITYKTEKTEIKEDNPEQTISPAPVATQEPTGKSIIGNKNSKVYHNPDCRYLPAEKNRIYFATDAEAEEKGYRACSYCH